MGLGHGFDILKVEAGEGGLASLGVADAEVVVDGRVETEGGEDAGDAGGAVGGLAGEDFDPAEGVLEGGDVGSALDGELDRGFGFGEGGLVGGVRGGEGICEVVGGEQVVGVDLADLAVERDGLIELAELFVEGGEGGEDVGAIRVREGLEGGEGVGVVVLLGVSGGEEDADGGSRIGIFLESGGEGVADFVGVGVAAKIGEGLVALDQGEREGLAGLVEGVEQAERGGGPAGFKEGLRKGEGVELGGGGGGIGGEFGEERINVGGEDVRIFGDGEKSGALLIDGERGESGFDGGEGAAGEELLVGGGVGSGEEFEGGAGIDGSGVGKGGGGLRRDGVLMLQKLEESKIEGGLFLCVGVEGVKEGNGVVVPATFTRGGGGEERGGLPGGGAGGGVVALLLGEVEGGGGIVGAEIGVVEDAVDLGGVVGGLGLEILQGGDSGVGMAGLKIKVGEGDRSREVLGGIGGMAFRILRASSGFAFRSRLGRWRAWRRSRPWWRRDARRVRRRPG